MLVFDRLAATVGCLMVTASALTAVEAHADGGRTIQTEAGVIVANYRPGNIPPSDAIVVGPGQYWEGWLDLDRDDADLKFYTPNLQALPDAWPWRLYQAHRVECGEPSDEDAFVTVTVDPNGLARIHCEPSS